MAGSKPCHPGHLLVEERPYKGPRNSFKLQEGRAMSNIGLIIEAKGVCVEWLTSLFDFWKLRESPALGMKREEDEQKTE